VHGIYIFVNVEIYTLKCGYEIFQHSKDDSEPIIITYKDNSDEWDLEYNQALSIALMEACKLIKTD
jgi:hypothetical protein